MLQEAVQSVLAQTYRSIEIIIVDDGSTDTTPEVARSLVQQYPQVIRWLQQPNRGPGPAREAGRQQARGEYIQYLDSDDRLLPTKFESQIQALRDNPECSIAYGYTRLIDEQGQELTAPFKWTGRDILYLFPGLLVDRWWCTHTPLYRRSVTDAIGPWSNLRWSQDWEYDARAGAMGVKLVNCHGYVSEHRHHSGDRQTAIADWFSETERLLNRVALLKALWTHAQKAGVPTTAPERQHFARWAFTIARHCGAAGLSAESRACLDIALDAGEAGMGQRGVKPYYWLCRLLGYRNAGNMAVWATKLKRSPGHATLPQSFAKQVP